MTELLCVEKVEKHFSTNGKTLPVLKEISLTLQKGEILCILGKSGCGKTTLLNIISGLEKPTAGNVARHGSLGYVPQKDLLLPWRTVMENILLPKEVQQSLTEESVRKAKALLRDLDLERFGQAYPNEISGGMRQKVSVIRTLLQDPSIVLFDEAFSAIDFNSRLMLGKRIRSYIIENKKSAIFVTHNIEEAISIGDRILVVSERPARIVEQIEVNIKESHRDPVRVRKTTRFQRLFARIWRLMRT